MVLTDGFALVRQIGEGAFGAVWMVRDRADLALKAAKVLKHRSRVARFLREINQNQRYGSLPYVMPILEAHPEAYTPFFIMPLAAGSLTKWAGRMNELQVLEAMRRLMETLAAVHSDGGFHRDIKPDNLLLMQDGTLRVADFGLGNNPNVTRNFTQTVQGTIAYLAPELFRPRSRFTAACDIHSAGATWFQLITGMSPGGRGWPLDIRSLARGWEWSASWISAMTNPEPRMRPQAAAVAIAIQRRVVELTAAPTVQPEQDALGDLLKVGAVVGLIALAAKALSS